MTDPLTGVPNRRHLFAQLEAELARAERYGTPLSILMIDVDHFKRLNDAAGHRDGRRGAAQGVRRAPPRVRKVDTLARYGGEEFMVLLPQTVKEGAVEVGEKLRRAVLDTAALAAPTQPTGHITISIGVASYPLDASDQETLVDCVDAALYASKRGGRNKVSAYEPGMEIHPGRERGPHASRTTDSPRPLPPAGVAKA